MEKLIILTGSLMGILRIRTQKDGTGVELVLRRGSPGAYTAYLVDGRGALCPVVLNAALRGGVERPFDVHAVLLTADAPQGVEFLAEGGFTGRAGMLEAAKRDVRILRAPNSAKGRAEPSPAPPPRQVGEGAELKKLVAVAKEETGPELKMPAAAAREDNGAAGQSMPETKLYSAGSAADAIGEQARLTKEYAARAQKAREEPEREDAFRAEETRQNSRVLDEIRKKADELFRPLDAQFAQSAAAPAPENAVYNPFPDAYPAAHWKKVNYPGTNRFYLEGEMEQNGVKLVLHALPGEYAPVPPMRRRGFTRFLRTADGSGYWVRVQRR